ncbi:MAG: DUF1800 family protein, partial [Variovorax sp.]
MCLPVATASIAVPSGDRLSYSSAEGLHLYKSLRIGHKALRGWRDASVDDTGGPMKNRRFVLSSAAALASGVMLAARSSQAAVATPLSADERALHAINRLGYGPRPADAAAIAAQGADKWLERFLTEQLEPRRLREPEGLRARLAGLEVLQLGQAELLGRYREAVKAAREARREQAQGMKAEADAINAVRDRIRPLVGQAATARLSRALQSPAQL